jgi:hypothetical protein
MLMMSRLNGAQTRGMFTQDPFEDKVMGTPTYFRTKILFWFCIVRIACNYFCALYLQRGVGIYEHDN